MSDSDITLDDLVGLDKLDPKTLPGGGEPFQLSPGQPLVSYTDSDLLDSCSLGGNPLASSSDVNKTSSGQQSMQLLGCSQDNQPPKRSPLQPLVPTGPVTDSSIILRANPQLCFPSKLPALALLLCKRSFFGDDVLSRSTVTGRKVKGVETYPLCPERMIQLKTVLRSVSGTQGGENFEEKWKKIKGSIADYCKKLRTCKSIVDSS